MMQDDISFRNCIIKRNRWYAYQYSFVVNYSDSFTVHSIEDLCFQVLSLIELKWIGKRMCWRLHNIRVRRCSVCIKILKSIDIWIRFGGQNFIANQRILFDCWFQLKINTFKYNVSTVLHKPMDFLNCYRGIVVKKKKPLKNK